MLRMPKVQPCASPNCYNDPKGRTYCSTCRARRFKDANPDRAAYHNLKGHAIERHIEFSLTLDGFREGIKGTRYLIDKGTSSDSLTIDRIIPELGYTDGNIQVLKNKDNIKKRNKDMYPAKYDHESAKQKAGTPF